MLVENFGQPLLSVLLVANLFLNRNQNAGFYFQHRGFPWSKAQVIQHTSSRHMSRIISILFSCHAAPPQFGSVVASILFVQVLGHERPFCGSAFQSSAEHESHRRYGTGRSPDTSATRQTSSTQKRPPQLTPCDARQSWGFPPVAARTAQPRSFA